MVIVVVAGGLEEKMNGGECGSQMNKDKPMWINMSPKNKDKLIINST